MDQHPIPRNVTGFEFQLIGFMTLKQFFYLLFSVGIGLAFWKSPLGIFSIPLAFVSGLIGVAFAFVPIQDRPLEVWIKNFITSIYSPTRFVWRKEQKLPDYLLSPKSISHKKNVKEDPALRQDTRNKLDAYLQSINDQNVGIVDRQEAALLKQVSSIIQDPSSVQALKITKPAQKTGVSTITSGIIDGRVRVENTGLSGILITVYDQKNEPVRMIRTNKSGHFRTKMPLPDGLYRLSTEDPSGKYQFKQYSFRVDDTPLKPWLLTPASEVS